MTKTFRLVLAAVCGSVVLSGCSSASPGAAPSAASSPAASSSAPAAVALAVGKSMMPLSAGRYRSPEGFQPALNLTVPDGWTSTHRGSDAFDLGKPDPARDAPLVAVVFFAPPAPTASAALAALRKVAATSGTLTTVTGDIGGVPAQGIDLDGGTGQLIASADNGIALDAAPGQRVRLLAADVAGRPLVVVILVPDGKQWDTVLAQATQLLSGVTAV